MTQLVLKEDEFPCIPIPPAQHNSRVIIKSKISVNQVCQIKPQKLRDTISTLWIELTLL